jgi:VanZ family protein
VRPAFLLRALPFLPALLCAGFMFWLSSQPNPLPFLPRALLSQDKLLHAIEYAVFAALVALPLARLAPRGVFLAAALTASAYGATDELHQAFVPGRVADVRDWIADSAGALLGAAAVVRWRARRKGAAPP